jgi:hypothetical protein
VRETKKIKRFRFALSACCPVCRCEPPKFYEPGFLLVYFQSEFCQAFLQRLQKAFRFISILKPQD